MSTTQDCIFCKIVAGSIPAHRVGENEGALAFLDVHPLVDGHVLVVPKTHVGLVADLDDEAAAAVFHLARDVTRAQRAQLGAEAVTIGVNDGPAAGQVVPHVHVHLIPRHAADGGANVHAIVSTPATRSLDAVAALLRGAGDAGGSSGA